MAGPENPVYPHATPLVANARRYRPFELGPPPQLPEFQQPLRPPMYPLDVVNIQRHNEVMERDNEILRRNEEVMERHNEVIERNNEIHAIIAELRRPMQLPNRQTLTEDEEIEDPADTEAGTGATCPVCLSRRSRPDICAFECAANVHPETMCGTCTRIVLCTGNAVCPLCSAPARGWIPTGRRV